MYKRTMTSTEQDFWYSGSTEITGKTEALKSIKSRDGVKERGWLWWGSTCQDNELQSANSNSNSNNQPAIADEVLEDATSTDYFE